MANFKSAVTSAIFSAPSVKKFVKGLSKVQQKAEAAAELEAANERLNNLYLELGMTSYRRKPVTPGRTSTVIRAEIDQAVQIVSSLKAKLDELNAEVEETVTETETTSEQPTEDPDTAEEAVPTTTEE